MKSLQVIAGVRCGFSTLEEASVVLHIKPQTLKSRLHRGRLILQEHMAEFASALTLHEREIH